MSDSKTNSRIKRGRFATTTRMGGVICFAPASDQFTASAYYRRVSEKTVGSKRDEIPVLGKPDLKSTRRLYRCPKMGYVSTVFVLHVVPILHQCPQARSVVENGPSV